MSFPIKSVCIVKIQQRKAYKTPAGHCVLKSCLSGKTSDKNMYNFYWSNSFLSQHFLWENWDRLESVSWHPYYCFDLALSASWCFFLSRGSYIITGKSDAILINVTEISYPNFLCTVFTIKPLQMWKIKQVLRLF